MAYRALLIGNSTFPDDPTLADLNGPRNDVEALYERLTDPVTGLFGSGDVAICADGSRAGIWDAVDDFAASVKREDTVLVYYSGHGIEADGRLFLAAHDTKQARPSTAVSMTDLNGTFEAFRADRRALILDCCHAGVGKPKSGSSTLERVLPKLPGWVRMYSSGYGTSQDGAEPTSKSKFTEVLVETLDQLVVQPGGAFVTVSSLFEAMAPELDRRNLPVKPPEGEGIIPIARRRRVEASALAADLPFVDLDELTEQDDELYLDIPRADHVTLEGLTNLARLTDLIELTQRLAAQQADETALRRVDLARNFLGERLVVPWLGRLSTIPRQPNTLVRLRIRQEGGLDDGLAGLPWEQLRLPQRIESVGGSAVLGSGPLALNSRVVLERATGVRSVFTAPERPIDDVVFFGSPDGGAVRDADEAILADLRTLGLSDKRRPWAALERMFVPQDWPPVLVLAPTLELVQGLQVPLEEAVVNLKVGPGRQITDARFIDSLPIPATGEAAPFRVIVLETFTEERSATAAQATGLLAHRLAKRGLGDVVFLCHSREFATYMEPSEYPSRDDEGTQRELLGTFVGFVLAALMKGQTTHRAVYAALSRMKSAYPFVCDTACGLPGVYAQDFAEPVARSATESARPVTSSVPGPGAVRVQKGVPDPKESAG
ncbi:caspase family protein [Cellulomonas sp. URHB0016]